LFLKYIWYVSEVSLAYWIMDDGYLIIMEELKQFFFDWSFTKESVSFFNHFRQIRYKSSLKIRDKINNRYRLGYLKLVLIELYF